MSSPVYNPGVPYTGPIQGGFLPGRMVRLQGRVNSSANSIAINLQTGPSSYDDVAIHVNPRFNESVIVRNARMQSAWGAEERHGPPLPLYRDQNFEIMILAEAGMFKIAVNGQHFAEFTHRIHPLDRINHINVEGDLTISLIQFDGAATQSSSYAPTAPSMGYGAPGGASPYPPSSALPNPGFMMPSGAGAAAPMSSPYPAAPGGYGGYPAAQPYGGAGAYPSAQPYAGGGYPAAQPPGGVGYPQGAPGGYYQPGGPHPPPQHGSGSSGGGLGGGLGGLLAGGLAGVGLAKVANKIPGLGGGCHHGGHGGGGGPLGGILGGGGHHGGGHHGGHGGGAGPLGGILGSAAALGIGGAVANKAMKKKSKGNMLKYGLPVGGAVLGGYALKKGMKGFHGHGHGSSSSSSSSSEEE